MNFTAELGRWWTYQRERFPLAAHGPLILAFSLCALCFSSLLRGSGHWPSLATIAVAFVSSLISFLHLRLADEFKDFEEDSRWRPYRPVPRGLVTLRELAVLWVITGAVQLALALTLHAALIIPLLVTWTYLGLMSHEFFCRRWLKAHPFTYMWTHMLIMPLIDFYATACDWMPAGDDAPRGLFWFVIVSFFNGFIIEIGRKMRAEESEEEGVETYTALWGRKRAVHAWWLVLMLTACSGLYAATLVHFRLPFGVVFTLMLAVGGGLGLRFLRAPVPANAKWLERFSGIWTLTLYLMLSIIPMLMRPAA